MKLRHKIYIACLCLAAYLLALGSTRLFAFPYDNVTSGEDLYQRVKKLGDYGLLDPRDKAVLDQGKTVSRLELAFYAEKAGSNLPPSNEDLKRGIRELLRELGEEAAYLRAHLSLQGTRLAQREDELEKLWPIQDELDEEWKKANQASGVPSFNSKGKFRVENLSLSGIATENAARIQDESAIGMWSDLGGKGSLSFGLGGVMSLSNSSAESAPVSLYTFTPAINFIMDGPLGRWSTNFAVEAYQPDTTLGDFVRGASPTALRRFTDPVNIVNFNEDQDTKNWDDYMSNIGFVPQNYLAAGNATSAGDRVFDGLYAIGTGLPWVSNDARLNVMLGRMGTTADQTQRWEEEVKYFQSWDKGFMRTSVAGTWVNDNFGPNQPNQLDMHNYAGELSFIRKPVFFSVEGAYSYLYAGPAYAPPLASGGGQAFVAFYPFAFYYSAIGDGYANFQSKVMMSGVHFDQYGQNFNFNQAGDMYGAIGEVDNLISDRYGWRMNLGWDGRQQDWMKGWPGFLDDFIINLDLAQKTEYKSETSPEGYNVIEPFNIITFYYPDDEGLWGRNLWGGWGPGESQVDPVRQLYTDNIQDIRNDGNSSWDDTRHQFQLTSERIPLILPAANEPVQDFNGKPVTLTNGANNTYINLNNLKTYNYITLTTKLKMDKMTGSSNPFYASFFFTDNEVSGFTTDPVLSYTPDPNRPGKTLADIPNLFEQVVYDIAVMYQCVKNVNLMGDYGFETWKSQYTFPLVDYRTDSIGGGLAYDLPWGGGKLELRYKHIIFNDAYVTANNYQGDQVFSTLMLLF